MGTAGVAKAAAPKAVAAVTAAGVVDTLVVGTGFTNVDPGIGTGMVVDGRGTLSVGTDAFGPDIALSDACLELGSPRTHLYISQNPIRAWQEVRASDIESTGD